MKYRAVVVCSCLFAMAASLGGCGSVGPVVNFSMTLGAPKTAKTARAENRVDHLRVMSANVRVDTLLDLHNNWNFRKDLVVRTIQHFDPDILGTQECLVHQTRYLRANLPGYHYVGVGRSDGVASGEMCGVFFKRDRFTQLDHGHFWLSATPDEPGSCSWGLFPRMVTWVKLKTRDEHQRAFYVFNTHFTISGTEGRVKSARILRQRMAAITRGAPTIVTGDFNAAEGTEPYRTMVQGRSATELAFTDTYRAVRPKRTDRERTLHGFSGRALGERRIDWILASPQFTTLAAAIDRTRRGDRYPSDHYPVTAVLRFDGTTFAAADQPPTSPGG